MKKFASVLCLLAAMVGCKPEPNRWRVEHLPMTQEERDAVERHVREVLCTTRRDLTVSGHDQDWDDYVKAVYEESRKSLCKPRLFEVNGETFQETGNYRDFTPAK